MWSIVRAWGETAWTLGPGVIAWSSATAIVWNDNVKYAIEVKAADLAGNVETAISSVTFIADNTPPSLTTVIPKSNTPYNTLVIASGSVNDGGSYGQYVTSVTVAVQRTGGNWWNGSNGFISATAVYSTATLNLPGWSYSGFGPYLADGNQYVFYMYPYDSAENSGVNPVAMQYDTEKPTSTITYPLPGYTTGFTQISGTAKDDADNSTAYEAGLGTYTVKVAVKRLTGTEIGWCNGANCLAVNPLWYEANLATTGAATGGFVYNLPGAFVSYMTDSARQNESYRLVSWSYDLAGNCQYGSCTGEPTDAEVTAAGAGTVVTHDGKKPLTYIILPSAVSHNTLANITGTAGDAAGIAETRFTVFQTAPAKYYDPSLNPVWSLGNEDGAPWLTAQATFYQYSSSWTYNVQNSTWSSGYTYRIRARAKDLAGNYDTVYATATFLYDNQAPVSTVTVPSDWSYINTLPVVLNGTSFDPGGAGVNQVTVYLQRVSDGKYWDSAQWQSGIQPFNAVPPYGNWTLPVGDSMFTGNDGQIFRVYTDARDGAVNQEGFGHKATFVYDVTRPTGAVTYPGNNGYISQTGKITGGSYDSPNGKVDNIFVRIKQLTGANPDKYWSILLNDWTVTNTTNSVLSYGSLSSGATWWQLNAGPWAT
ncbi:MAG: hypothetical protein AAB359_01355, partial [Elusimicrobiota bacterium]